MCGTCLGQIGFMISAKRERALALVRRLVRRTFRTHFRTRRSTTSEVRRAAVARCDSPPQTGNKNSPTRGSCAVKLPLNPQNYITLLYLSVEFYCLHLRASILRRETQPTNFSSLPDCCAKASHDLERQNLLNLNLP
jgi:hypothetical protein